MEGGMKNWRLMTTVSLYFEKGTRYGRSYNVRQIGTYMRYISWCHVQRLWVTRT